MKIDRADANLSGRLDRLMPQFDADHPAFAAAYWTARKIVDAGAPRSPEANPEPAPSS